MAVKKTPVQQAIELLNSTQLSVEDRNLLTTTLLDKLGALPVRARIMVERDGHGVAQQILFDGKPVAPKLAVRLQQSARSLLNNFARKLVQETIVFLAIKQGVHQNVSPEQGLFAKAILWQHHEEQELYDLLAQTGTE